MKDIILLIRQRKEFYLTVLVITLLLTIIGAFYNIHATYKGLSEEVAHIELVTEEQIRAMAENNPDLLVRGANSNNLMIGFYNNYIYMAHTGLVLVMIAVLLLGYIDRNEKSTREFMETLPVKRVALELYHYVASVGILFLNVLTALGIHIIALCHYNSKIVALAKRFPEIVGELVPTGLVTDNVMLLLYQFGMLTLYFTVMITLWFVCMSIFKNGTVGLFAGLILWNSMTSIMSKTRWLILSNDEARFTITDSFRQMMAVFNPRLYFDHFKYAEGKCVNAFTPFVATTLLIMLVLLIGILVVHSFYRELSKGKLFFWNGFNIILLLAGGYGLFTFVLDWYGFGHPISLPLATVVTAVVEIAAIMWLYRKKRKTYKLAVKEQRKVRNPVAAQGLRSFLIAAGVITLLTEYIDLEYNLTWLRYDLADINLYGWFPEEPWHLVFFDTYYRFQFAMPILIGFIIFKCIQFGMERRKETGEFYETLPVSRLRLYCTKLLMDLGTILIPLTVYTTVSLVHLDSFNRQAQRIYPELQESAMVSEQFVNAFFVLCLAAALLGVMYLVDAVAVSGGMKNIYCDVIALFIFVTSLHLLNYTFSVPVVSDMIGMIWGEPTLLSAIIYLILGVGLLILAGTLFIRRDKAKEIFYFKPAKYVFATLLSISYLIFVMSGAYLDQALYQYILAVIGTVLIFFLTIWYCTPGRMAELQKKFRMKKAK